MNKVILIGNLSRDIELKYLPNGGAIATTAIATTEKFKKQDGSQGENVLFIDLTFFGKSAETANQYLQKGSKVGISGKLKLDQWTDQQGGKRSKYSVTVESMEMLTPRSGEQRPQQSAPSQQDSQEHRQFPEMDINDDEIPFSGGTR